MENTLRNMKDNTGFFKTKHDREHGWMLNNHPIEILRGTEVEIKSIKYNITICLEKVFTDRSYDTANSTIDTEKLVFRNISQ